MQLRNLFAPVLVALLAVNAGPAIADDAMSTGVKAEMIHVIADAETKLNDLAAAMPAAKYSWRPMKGVRSVGEVYMHVAAANYGMPSMMGVAAPAGFEFEKYESSLTKKDDIQKALKESFVSLKAGLTNMSDADMEKQADIMGMKMSYRGVYMMLLSHAHEHLGQSIAYARSNGIVPPWTVAEHAKEKAKAKDSMKMGDHDHK